MKTIIKKVFLILLISALASMCLCGCAAREFLATLGFDTHDYEGEAVIATYEPDSDKAAELSEMVKTLTMGSADIPTFDGTKEAMECCRDSLLNYMLSNSYSKYTGNMELLEAAAAEYPQMRFSVIIPAEDFANEAYKYFGGKERVSMESGDMFEYLEKTECYITAAQPQKNNITVSVISLEETEQTYRMRFSCSDEDGDGKTYFALIIKRADDSCYFKYVTGESRS